MKTSKAKATANKKTTTTIVIEIDGVKYNVSEADAKSIWQELHKIFSPPEVFKANRWLDWPHNPYPPRPIIYEKPAPPEIRFPNVTC